MKLSSSALDVLAALLAVSAVTAFVPNSHRTNPNQVRNQILPTSSTECSASQSFESESFPRFPFNEKQVRFAYDEWRLIYGKGDFDSDRFEQFKRNHRTVTVSNLNARDKASREGRPKPQWMSLNEYGDYSMEEYEAMLRGEQPAVNGDYSIANSSSSEARDQLVPVTQQALKQGQHRPTFLVGDDYAANTGQVQEHQDQFGRPIHSASTTSNNYANNIDNENGDSSSSGMRGTLIIPKGEGSKDRKRGTQIIKNSSSARGTQVINPASSVRGTQVINPSPSIRGTHVVNPSYSARGTQVINPAPSARGTHVVQPISAGITARSGTQVVAKSLNDGSNSSYGTQVINQSRGTQVVRSGNNQMNASESYGTQVIKYANPGGDDGRGAQASQSSFDPDPREDEYSSAFIPGGTQIILGGGNDGKGSGRREGGTLVVSKDDKESWSDILGKIFSESEKEEDDIDDNVAPRGTRVIKRSIEVAEPKTLKSPFNFFGSGGTEKEKKSDVDEDPVQGDQPSVGNPFFNFGSSGTEKEKENIVKEEPVQEEEPSGGNSFFNFGSSGTEKEKKTVAKEEEPVQEEEPSSGNSFFNFGSSGTVKEKENVVKEEEPVQEEEPFSGNSFFNFMSPKENSAAKENVEVEIEEQVDAEKEDKIGSIFSFFGGNVKTANPRTVRTTITLQKHTPSAKKSQATKARRQTKLIPENQSENGVPSILSFFGGAKKVTEEETARNPNSRPTLIVNKPQKNQFWSAFTTKKKSDKVPEEATASSPKNKVRTITHTPKSRSKKDCVLFHV